MLALEQSLGPVLVGSFVNTILYAIELLWVAHYLRHPRPSDSLLLKCFIAIILLSDTLCTIATCACVYLYTVTHWGTSLSIEKRYWPLSSIVGSTAVTACLVQFFLVFRYFRISRNWAVAAVLSVLTLSCFVGTIGTAVAIVVFIRPSEHQTVMTFVTLWLSTSAGTDVGIAAALIWQLSRMNAVFPATSGLITRLIVGAVQTGSTPCLLALASLIAYLPTNQYSGIPGAFVFCIGRVYALTMLYNLNVRTAVRRESVCCRSTGEPEFSTTMSGIFVTHEAATYHSEAATYQSTAVSTLRNSDPMNIEDTHLKDFS